MVGSDGPEFQKMDTERAKLLLDYDANRRRLQEHETTKTDLQNKGRYHDDTQRNHDMKIEKYETKKTISGKAYEDINDKAKSFALESKAKHDELVDETLITTAVAQLEYYKRAATELQKVVDCLPQGQVNHVTKRFQEIIDTGSHILPVSNGSEDSSKRRGSSLFDGMSTVFQSTRKSGSSKNTGGAPAATPPSDPSIAKASALSNLPQATEVSSNGDTSNPWGNDDSPAATPAATSTTAPAGTQYPIVIAIHDHDAEADDELAFKAGDRVEVLETGDSGWWSGRAHGKMGVFAVDYVDISTMK
jgi:hypothetical protein